LKTKTYSKENIRINLSYLLAKYLSKNKYTTIKLKNRLKYIIRPGSMDQAVLKEIWQKEIYNKFDVFVEADDTVVDIGAHIGVFSIYASKLSTTGRVFALEPFVNNYELLIKNKELNSLDNLSVFNIGCSGKSGMQTLHISQDKNTGGHSMHLKSQSMETIQIETIRLSEFCEKNNINKIDFLKMDCEGAEFEILESDEAVLKIVNKIAMECHPYNKFTGDTIVSILQKYNFEVFHENQNQHSKQFMIYGKKK
jgi:FkbM family methyltransferase